LMIFKVFSKLSNYMIIKKKIEEYYK